MKNKKLIPEIRFPAFNGEWIEKHFTQIFETISTKQYQIKNSEILTVGKYPVIDQGLKKIAGYSNNDNKVLKNSGIIVFGDHTTILKYINFNFIIGADGVKLLKNRKNNLNLKFLYYTLEFNKIKPEGYKRHFSILKQLKIHIPPTLDEQKKIADFLSNVDEKIEIISKKIEELKKYKKGIIQKLLDVKCNNGKCEPELRFKGFSGNWIENKLGKIVNNITTGKLDANAMVEDGKYKFFTCAKEVYSINKYAFDDEAILISGNGANVGYIHYFKGKFNAYQRTYVLTNFNNNIFFIKFYLEFRLKKHINKEKNEGNTPYIKLGTLINFKLYFPPTLAEQQKIANFLSSIDEKIELNENKLEKLKAYKKGLLQKMFV